VNEAEKVPRMKIDEPKTPFHVLDDSTLISIYLGFTIAFIPLVEISNVLH
jgi:hypothetical protein